MFAAMITGGSMMTSCSSDDDFDAGTSCSS